MAPKTRNDSGDDATSQSTPAPEAPTPAAVPVASGPELPKRTPAEWAEKLGHAFPARANIPQSSPRVSPEHAAADSLHGWSTHAYDFQAAKDRFEITEADYLSALAAAPKFPTVAPHDPALPESQRSRFSNFQPRAARAKGRS